MNHSGVGFSGPVVIDVKGTELTEEDIALIDRKEVGGVILFSRNYENKAQLCALTAAIKKINPACLIAVDHEGGRVQRFREGFTRIPAMQKLGELYKSDPDLALEGSRNIGWLLAVELIACQIDISFTPVLDVDDSLSDIIGDRSFSPDAIMATQLAGALIDGMKEAGMACTGKHFPGHGGVKQDSHLELPIDVRNMSDIEARDLIPFKKLLPSLDAVMPAHIIFSDMDSKPVGFSEVWLKDYLRNDLGYEGIIFSDDLSMEGAAGVGAYCLRAKLAIEAGCDSVLVCNNRDGAIEVIEYISQNPDLLINSRLDRMLAKREWSHDEVAHSQRAQETRDFIHLLS